MRGGPGKRHCALLTVCGGNLRTHPVFIDLLHGREARPDGFSKNVPKHKHTSKKAGTPRVKHINCVHSILKAPHRKCDTECVKCIKKGKCSFIDESPVWALTSKYIVVNTDTYLAVFHNVAQRDASEESHGC